METNMERDEHKKEYEQGKKSRQKEIEGHLETEMKGDRWTRRETHEEKQAKRGRHIHLVNVTL